MDVSICFIVVVGWYVGVGGSYWWVWVVFVKLLFVFVGNFDGDGF